MRAAARMRMLRRSVFAISLLTFFMVAEISPVESAQTGSTTTAQRSPYRHLARKAKKAKTATPLPLKQAVIGKWEQIGGADHLEFGKDGGFRAANSQATLIGKYVMHDDGTMNIDLGLPVAGSTIVRKVVLEHDQLTLTDVKSGLVMKYRRAK